MPIDADIIEHNFPEHNSGTKKARGAESSPDGFVMVGGEDRSPPLQIEPMKTEDEGLRMAQAIEKPQINVD